MIFKRFQLLWQFMLNRDSFVGGCYIRECTNDMLSRSLVVMATGSHDN